MTDEELSRADRKRATILEAATDLFLLKGYDGTSMDDVATQAGVSKPTVYKYFVDKERLFADIILATTDQMEGIVRLVAATLGEAKDLEADLRFLARRFAGAIMEPELLQLRRLVIANADRFPEVSRSWYEQGFARALSTLASRLELLAEQGVLEIDDPMIAADHFFALLLWIPVNRAMFTGDDHLVTESELDRYADIAVHTFLRAYGRRENHAHG